VAGDFAEPTFPFVPGQRTVMSYIFCILLPLAESTLKKTAEGGQEF